MKFIVTVALVLVCFASCKAKPEKQPDPSIPKASSLSDLVWLTPSGEVYFHFGADDEELPNVSIAVMNDQEIYFKLEHMFATHDPLPVISGVMVVDESYSELFSILKEDMFGGIDEVGDHTATLRISADPFFGSYGGVLIHDEEYKALLDKSRSVEFPVLWACGRDLELESKSAKDKVPVFVSDRIPFNDWFVSADGIINDDWDSAHIGLKDMPADAVAGLKDGSACLIVWQFTARAYMLVLGGPVIPGN